MTNHLTLIYVYDMSSSTRAILLTSLAIYSCIPLKAIQYYINIDNNKTVIDVHTENYPQFKSDSESDTMQYIPYILQFKI